MVVKVVTVHEPSSTGTQVTDIYDCLGPLTFHGRPYVLGVFEICSW